MSQETSNRQVVGRRLDRLVGPLVAHYRLPEYDPDEVYQCPIGERETQTDLAKMCAEYHHDHRDGWEMSWPLVVELVQVNADGGVWSSLGAWLVEREMVPVFSARKR